MEMDENLGETRYFYGRARFQRGEFAEAARLFEEASRDAMIMSHSSLPRRPYCARE